jgi:hypothetical protein
MNEIRAVDHLTIYAFFTESKPLAAFEILIAHLLCPVATVLNPQVTALPTSGLGLRCYDVIIMGLH